MYSFLNLQQVGLSKRLPKWLLWGFVLVIFFVSNLTAQVNFNFNYSKTETTNWFKMEPGEEFFLEGSKNFLKDASTLKYYPTVANFFTFFGLSKNSLGLKLSWDRLGTHYADIIPKMVREKPDTYPVEDLVKISMWVWSAGYKHELAVIFKRLDGYVYSLRIAKLNFKGWKKFNVNIPLVVKSRKNSMNVFEKYYFDRFRIYTSPREKVGDVYVFLDEVDVTMERYTSYYDGFDIEEIIRREKLEGEGDGKDQSQAEEAPESSESANGDN